ncbi:hypothetical protein VPNG_04271 [Cytospora leucostoma]|uniref:Bromo domain-containing protein n=1 Tax=Cytospora leucostoma TaxID=1230097 RepID=A0A423XDN7_9PEZI|nr:hypothetical protein VPNG_04271 [Cytospora leucostoma]
MDNKRKASASNRGGGVDGGEPASKRRKLPSDFPDLSKQESHESTTAYGLSFLEAIRKTADKYGRGVAGYFEKLLPKEGNEDYYNKIRMPVSLRVIERRLYRQEFADMSELESWLKRMVNNAKEYYPRHSQTYEDAERVRKATSNYMVKTNPAYKSQTYAATPAPIPPDFDVDAELAAEELPSEMAANDMSTRLPQQQQPLQRPEQQDPTQQLTGEEDAEGEDEEMLDAEGEEDDGEADDGEADADADVDANRGSNTRIVLKRRGQRSNETEDTPDAPSTSGDKGDGQYSEVSYQGLTFQQAQEKIVDELMRRTEEDEEWPYFEPFLNLPPKSLKDYYQLIEEPMSLKKLWRAVKGMHGRQGATGISDFKSWAAMEEKASLLAQGKSLLHWAFAKQARYISNIAQDYFYEQLNEAKSCVEEPPQPKIKLRAPSAQAQQTQPGRPKRITIHVGGGREGSQGSPAPQAAQTNGAVDEVAIGGAPRPTSVIPVEAKSNQSIAAPGTPAAVMKREDSNRTSPAVPTQPQMSNGYSASAFRPVMPPPVNGYHGQPQPQGISNGHAIVQQQQHQQQQQPPPPPPQQQPQQQLQQPTALFDIKYRCPGASTSEAVLTNLCIRTPLDNNPERRFVFNIPPSPRLLHQSFTINLSATQWKLQIVPRISPALEQQQRPYKLYVLVNGQTLARGIPNPRDPIHNGELLYDAQLHQGVNTIVVQMIAALPKGQTLPNGSDAVLEKITILANVLKQF